MLGKVIMVLLLFARAVFGLAAEIYRYKNYN